MSMNINNNNNKNEIKNVIKTAITNREVSIKKIIDNDKTIDKNINLNEQDINLESNNSNKIIQENKIENKREDTSIYDITNTFDNLNISTRSDNINTDKILIYDTFQDIPETLKPSITGLVYDLRSLIHKDSSEHPERPERISAIIDKFKSNGTLERCKYIKSRRATTEELLTVHKIEHINHIRENSEDIPEDFKPNKYLKVSNYDNDTYYNIYSSHLADLAVGGLINLCDEIMTENISNGAAIIRPPGHHAECNKAMGFCLYNNVAVAAKVMQEKYNAKVLIVDWDVHHGNGTQNMFYDSNQILYFSIHRSNFYPHTGRVDECGKRRGLGYNVNVPIPGPNLGDPEYVQVWESILIPIAKSFAPNIILVSAGFDAAIYDPLGEMEIFPECYAYMTKSLMQVCPKVVVAFEGGYNLESISNSADMCLRALLGDNLPFPDLTYPRLSRELKLEKLTYDLYVTSLKKIITIQKEFWPNVIFKSIYDIILEQLQYYPNIINSDNSDLFNPDL